MTNDNQTNLNEKEPIVTEEDTEISLPPPAPNFETAQAAPVQPVIPVAPVTGDQLGAFPQQPQVVYVAQPTTIQPQRSWGWIPAALALLVVATIAGVFIGAELYKRSIYAESAAPYSSTDVLPSANLNANENKSAKSGEVNSLSDRNEISSSESSKSSDEKSEARQINSLSTLTPIQRTELRENGDNSARLSDNAGEENNQQESEAADEDSERADENKAEKSELQSKPEEEDAPPPVKRKSKDLQPRKVENVKDTENIVPPQREMPF